MMVIKVGINGFGRVGRIVFRTCLERPDLEISAINDPAVDVEYICYLIKFDSTHGKFKGEVTNIGNEITLNGTTTLKIFHQKTPSAIPWQIAGVQYVVESSGMFTSNEKASGHLASSTVKRVILTALSMDVPMVILGVNQSKMSTDWRVVSCGSSTLYCLAPIVKLLDDKYGVEDGFVTSIHAMTPSLKPVDGLCLRGKQHWRDHRSIHQNIIPARTGACKALGKIIPSVKDKLAGLAFRVPIANVSILDLNIRLKNTTSLREIVRAVETLNKTSEYNIINVSKEQAVSSDFIGNCHSCILDVDSSMELNPNYYKLICWYENEYSYACRVLDLIYFFETHELLPAPKPKMVCVRPRITKKPDPAQQTAFLRDICLDPSTIDFMPRVTSTNHNFNFKQKLSLYTPMRKKTTQSSVGNQSNIVQTNKKEVLKAWGDSTPAPKPVTQPKMSNFQSNFEENSNDTKHNTNGLKAQERLEKVKKEFSKMVNITEDLLKKTHSKRMQLCGTATESANMELALQISDITADERVQEQQKPLNTTYTLKCKKDPLYTSLRETKPVDVSQGTVSVKFNDTEMTSTCNRERDMASTYSVDFNDLDESKANIDDIMSNVKESRKIIHQKCLFITNQTPVLETNVSDIIAKQQTNIQIIKEQLTKTMHDIMDGLKKLASTDDIKDERMEINISDCKVPTSSHDISQKIGKLRAIQNSTKNKDRFTRHNVNREIDNLKQHMNTFNIINESLQVHNLVLSNNKPDQRDEAFHHRDDHHTALIPRGGTRTTDEPLRDVKRIKSDDKITNEPMHKDDHVQLQDNNEYEAAYLTPKEVSEAALPEITSSEAMPSEIFRDDRSSVRSPIDSLLEYSVNPLLFEPIICAIEKENDEVSNKTLQQDLESDSVILDLKSSQNNMCDDLEDNDDAHKVDARNTQPINNKIDSNVARQDFVKGHDKNQLDSAQTEKDEYEDCPDAHISMWDKASEYSTALSPSTVLSQDVYRFKQDIYDKLSSLSGSNSESSFQIDKRKSQVINISDLTNSLDDLARLDKICRIIEISDELSDKLFASLENLDDVISSAGERKWSFRDLCEKIKLDEFCNKVFGKK